MSMLTPPGMGGKYRIKGDRYPNMRRPRNRRRTVLVALSSVVAVAVLGWGAFQLVDVFTGGTTVRATGASGPDCAGREKDGRDGAAAEGAREADRKPAPGKSPGAAALPKPSSVTVNVLNATARNGLAKATSRELEKRGFRVGRIGNASAELDKKIEATAVLVGAPGKRTTARMKVLGTQVADTETRYDDRDGEEIDLVLGNDFRELAPREAAEKTLAALAEPSPRPASPRPSATSC